MERRSNHTTTHSFSPHSLHILRLHFTQRFLVCLFEIRNFGFGSVYFLLQSIDFTYKAKDTHTCDPNRLGSFPILSEIVVGDYNIARIRSIFRSSHLGLNQLKLTISCICFFQNHIFLLHLPNLLFKSLSTT